MSFLLRLALRNLVRHRRRTLLSLVAIVAGVATLIVGKGFLAGLTENFMRAQIDMVSGHVVVRPEGYPSARLNHPVDRAFDVPDTLESWLAGQGAVATRRLVFSPTVVAGPDSLRARAVGYDPETDEAVFPRGAWKVVGEIPETAEEGVMVSGGLARLLRVEPGSTITLQARTVAGSINALSVPVAGVVSTGNPWVDLLGLFVPLPLAEELLAARGKATHLAVRQASRTIEGAEALAAALPGRFEAPVEASTWWTETEEVLGLQEIRQRGLDLLVFMLLGISATGIANTVLMAAYERIREIGTLRAMGMTEQTVLRMFLAEGALLGLVGALLGCLAGVAIVSWFEVNGIDLSASIGSTGAHLPISAMLYTALDTFWVGVAFVFGVSTSVLASIWPARIAARMQPADAVRAP